MKYWRVGQQGDEPTDLPIKPGPKHLVTVRVLVDSPDEDEATDIVGEMMRGQETFLTDGPIVDWAVGRSELYQLPEEYEEGEAFGQAAHPRVVLLVHNNSVRTVVANQPVDVLVLDDSLEGEPPRAVDHEGKTYAVVHDEGGLVVHADTRLADRLVDAAGIGPTQSVSRPSPSSEGAFWLRYYVARLEAAAQDSDGVPPVEFRRWVEEIVPDLDDLAATLPLRPEQKRLAEALASAMQAFIFHGGPNPDTLPAFQSLPGSIERKASAAKHEGGR